jgi:hypothetical protein
VVDPDEDDGVTLESVAKWLRAKAPEGPCVLIADSLQTIAQFVPDSIAETLRGKVDYVLRLAKKLARTLKIFIVLLSELSRAAYKFRGESQVEDIAAGKESGGIEYAVTALTLIRSVPKSDGLVRVTMPKSRLGRVEEFALRQSYVRALFEPAELPGGGPEEGDDPETAWEDLCEAVYKCIKDNPGIGGAAPISARLQRRKADVAAALVDLTTANRIVMKGSKNNGKWFIQAGSEEKDDG